MSKQKFCELDSLDLLEEGNFIAEANQALRDLSRALAAFRKEHGNAAKGSKAELKLAVVLKCENADQLLFSIRTAIDRKLPTRPARVTTALETSADDETETLFVRLSGSDGSHPSQLKLATSDGREIVDGKANAIKE